MALTYSLVYNGAENSTTLGRHTYDANFGTISTGALLVMCVTATKSPSGASNILSIAQQSGTATISSVTTIDNTAASSTDQAALSIFYATVTGGGTLTMRASDNMNTYGLGVIAIGFTGYDTSTPILGVVKNNALSIDGAASLTLSATPTVNDYVVGFVNSDTDTGSGKGVDPGSGFTEVAEVGGASDYIMTEAQVRTGSTSTNVPWADVRTSGAPATYTTIGGAFIVKATPPVSTITAISTVSGISSITL